MREKGIGEGITFDLEIEWTVLAKLRAKRLAQASALEVKDTLTDGSMGITTIYLHNLVEL
jgi:hypothetical protein